MIRRQTKWILIALAVCLALGAVLLILFATVWKDSGEGEGENEVFMAAPLGLDEIAEIFVQNKNASYRLYRGTDGELYFEGAEYVLYNSNMIAFLRSCCAYLSVNGEVKDPAPFTEYALTEDSCLASFSVRSLAGERYRVLVGDKLVGGEGYYARLDADARVFVLGTALENCLFSDVRLFLSAQVAAPLPASSYFDITDFSIYKRGDLFMEIEKVPEDEASDTDLSTHRVSFPAYYEPDTMLVSAVFKSFISLTGERVEVYGISEKSAADFAALMTDYGFVDAEQAQMVHEVRYLYQGAQTNFYVSALDAENEAYYVYSPGFDIIVSFAARNLEWVDYDLMQFTQPELFARSIGKVASVAIKSADVDAAFTLTHKEAASDLVVKEGVAVITTAYFRQFYNQILYIKNLGYAEVPADLSKLDSLSLTITMTDGAVYDFVFYDISSRQSYYTINGEGVFYVNRDYIKKLSSDAVLLKTNQAVEARQFA